MQQLLIPFYKKRLPAIVVLSLFWGLASHCIAEPSTSPEGFAYQLPAAELQVLVDAPRGPQIRLSPSARQALLIQLPGLPGIADIAQPEWRLAGLRINPRMHAASQFEFGSALSLLDSQTGRQRPVLGLPANPRIADSQWSPDEQYLAFSLWGQHGVELWLLDVVSARARRLLAEHLNTTVGSGFSWGQGSSALLVRLVSRQQRGIPPAPALPGGPGIQESRAGKTSQNRTYPDMLKTSHDADLLDWALQTQLAWVDLAGHCRYIGTAGTLIRSQPSPDGKFILVARMHRPYSTQLPYERFPQAFELWDGSGKKLRTIVDRPLREHLPTGADAVQAGAREIGWRSDKPASLYWLEAQAGGDPEVSSKVHDVLMQQEASGQHPASKLLELSMRFSSVQWANDGLALVTESWRKTRDSKTWRIFPASPELKPELLFSRKTEDAYANPGNPVMTQNQYGKAVLRTTADGKSIYLSGNGASPDGDRPFLDRFDLASRQTQRLFRSQAPFYEEVVGILNDKASLLLTSRESNEERPNYYLRDLSGSEAVRPITQFPNPFPQLKGIRKQQLRYQREDGVDLTATLYLPPGYEPKRDGPRPLLMWAYPREFKSAEAASQVTGSPYRFNRISYNSPMAMLTRGYVVLDGPGMPIIGEGKKEPNDTYTEQLKMDAEAAVEEVVRLGVADRNRIAIGGHSYGAFMTANLLAHTRLFRAGIARSGAYNRTLTPFGFQSEDRNFWQARKTYQDMSPFNYANQIKDPLLLIHGEQDNNSGTFPIQSERMFQALQGLGSPARLVMLPDESHSYRARESILHMLWEQDRWLTMYVKNAKPDNSRD